MHLVDTSIWIEALRASGSSRIRTELEPLIRAGDVALTEWVILELMVGIRSNETAAGVLHRLSAVHRLTLLHEGWTSAWDLAARLRKKAITPTAADCLIATIAIAHSATLLHCDQDFEHMAKHEKDLRTIDWTSLL